MTSTAWTEDKLSVFREDFRARSSQLYSRSFMTRRWSILADEEEENDSGYNVCGTQPYFCAKGLDQRFVSWLQCSSDAHLEQVDGHIELTTIANWVTIDMPNKTTVHWFVNEVDHILQVVVTPSGRAEKRQYRGLLHRATKSTHSSLS
jgi:hypothetical protein